MSAASDGATVLLVEPDSELADLFRAAFEEGRAATDVRVAESADAALEFVRRREDDERSGPDIAVLDASLPEETAADVLSELESTAALRRLPVIVMGDSVGDAAVTESYDRHANAYVERPDGPEAVAALVRSIETFWLTYARLPP